MNKPQDITLREIEHTLAGPVRVYDTKNNLLADNLLLEPIEPELYDFHVLLITATGNAVEIVIDK